MFSQSVENKWKIILWVNDIESSTEKQSFEISKDKLVGFEEEKV